MREIAEFVAVLSCSLFAGAAIYINLVEHPARMECGVEIAATEFPPSYRRAMVMQATLAAVGLTLLHSSMAHWGDILVVRWRNSDRLSDPIHADRDSADEQEVTQSYTR